MQNNEQTPMTGINMEDFPWLACTCGSKIFDSGVMVKRISSLVSPTGREELIPAEIITCKSCGKIPDFYAKKVKGLPDELIAKVNE